MASPGILFEACAAVVATATAVGATQLLLRSLHGRAPQAMHLPEHADITVQESSPLSKTLLDLGFEVYTHINEQLGSDQSGIRTRTLLGSINREARAFFLVLREGNPSAFSPPRVLRFELIELGYYDGINEAEGGVAVCRAYDTAQNLPCNLVSCPRESLDRSRFLREQRALDRLALHPHQFISRLGHSYEDSTHLHMTTLPCLAQYICLDQRESPALPEAEVCFYAAQISIAIEHLHHVGIIHRAVAVDNVVIGAGGHAVLGGFHCSIQRDDVHAAQAGTMLGIPEYMAPEVIRGQPYNGKVDFWGLGCLMYELLTGRSPFHSDSVAGVLGLILFTGPPPLGPPAVSPSTRSCIDSLLVRDANVRVGNLAELRSQPLFADFDWQALETDGTLAPLLVD